MTRVFCDPLYDFSVLIQLYICIHIKVLRQEQEVQKEQRVLCSPGGDTDNTDTDIDVAVDAGSEGAIRRTAEIRKVGL